MIEGRHCIRHEGKQCPPEGCSADYGCAVDHGWSQGEPTPLGCDGTREPVDVPASWCRRVSFVVGFFSALVVLLALALYNAGLILADMLINEMHPAAWGVILVVASFTLAMVLPFWLYCIYGVCATAFALWLYLERT